MSAARTIGEAVFRVRPDLKGFGDKVRSETGPASERASEEAGKRSTRGFMRSFGPGLKTAFKAAAGLAAVAGAKELISSTTDKFVELAGNVRQAQRVLGGTTEEVSGLRAAFGSSGVDLTKFQTSMTIFSKTVGNAAAGSSNLADIQTKLGVSFRDAEGNLRPQAAVVDDLMAKLQGASGDTRKLAAWQNILGANVLDNNGKLMPYGKLIQKVSFGVAKASASSGKAAVLTQLLGDSWRDASGKAKPLVQLLPGLADQFAKMPDGAEKTALATQLFGKSGTAMLPALNGGSAGLEELTKKAKEMGLVLDDASMDKFVKYKKANREWHESLEGVQVTMGSLLMPQLTKLSTWLTKTGGPYLRKFISGMEDGTGAGGQFADAASRAASAVEVGGKILFRVAGFLADHKTAVIGLVAAYATYRAISMGMAAVSAIQLVLLKAQTVGTVEQAVASRVAGTAAKVWAAGQWLLNAAMSANPITLIVIGIAALVAGFIYAYKHSETFRDIVQGAMRGIANAFIWMWNNAASPILKWLILGFGKVTAVWAKVLGALGKVPGFGWAKKAAAGMTAVAAGATALAGKIQKIPYKHDTKITASPKQALAAGANVKDMMSRLNQTTAKPKIYVDDSPGRKTAGSFKKYLNDLFGKGVTQHVTVDRSAGGLIPKKKKAMGGPVEAGEEYWVGENGPEVFTTSKSGRIIPNHKVAAVTSAARRVGSGAGVAAAGNDAAAALLARLLEQGLVLRVDGEDFRGYVEGRADSRIDTAAGYSDHLSRLGA